jgi:hypothetical protein
MIVFVLLGQVPIVLAVALAGMVYLTWIEVRAEPVTPMAKLWWCLLVLLFNVAGYLVLRIALAVWRNRRRS